MTGRSLRSHSYQLLRCLGSLGGSLTRLDLTGVALGTLGLSALERAELPALAELNVDAVSYMGAATAGFAAAPPRWAAALTSLSFVGTSLSRRWRLRWFAGLRRFTGRLADPDAILHVASWARLTELRLHATRVCNLRADVAEWRSVLASLEALTLVDCDLLPRPHLQQPAEAVLLDVLLRAPALRELRLVGCAPPLEDALLDRTLPVLAARVRRAAARTAAARQPSRLREVPAPPLSLTASQAEEEEEEERRLQPLQYRGDVLPAERSREPFHTLVLEPSDRLGDVSLGLIGEALGGTLRRLRLGPCSPRITDAGLEVLAASCPLLERLELPFAAHIGGLGVAALARSRASMGGRLQHVNLSRCGLRSSGPLLELAQRAGGGLRELFIRGCHAAVDEGDGGAAVLRALAARGCSVHYDRPPPAPAASSCGLQSQRAAELAAGGDAPPTGGNDDHVAGGGGGGGGGERGAPPAPAHARIACPLGCGQLVRPADVEDHAGGVCTHAHAACVNAGSGCPFTARRGDTAAHSAHLLVCPKWLVSCGACRESVPRAGYAAHARRHWGALEGEEEGGAAA